MREAVYEWFLDSFNNRDNFKSLGISYYDVSHISTNIDNMKKKWPEEYVAAKLMYKREYEDR